MSMFAPAIGRRSTAQVAAGDGVLSWLGAVTVRRRLQVALGVIWLIDAALQFQPYMFGRDFVTQTLEPAAAGNMWLVEQPALLADHFMIHHITFYDSIFAVFQLLIAAAIFYRPTVKIGLGVSVVWSFGVWWLAEGIGGVTNGASPFMGAPGAVILYALVALLVWPRPDGELGAGHSVADGGLLGEKTPKVLWAVLWVSFIALGLEVANRAPSALHDMVYGMQSGEAGWIKAMDRGLAAPLAHHGTEFSIAFAILFGLAAIGVFARPTTRIAVVIAMALGLVIWLTQDFGTIFTGSATDVNSGLPLMLLAACYWPTRKDAPSVTEIPSS
jgi:hypothetical protein